MNLTWIAHASTVFKNKIWVVGGNTFRYYSSSIIPTNARSDVWVSADGEKWDLVVREAPWLQRYGHTLTTFNRLGESVMVLLGGFSPKPAHDVWITRDGGTSVRTYIAFDWSIHSLSVLQSSYLLNHPSISLFIHASMHPCIHASIHLFIFSFMYRIRVHEENSR